MPRCMLSGLQYKKCESYPYNILQYPCETCTLNMHLCIVTHSTNTPLSVKDTKGLKGNTVLKGRKQLP